MAHTITITRLAADKYDAPDYVTGGDCDSGCETWRECPKVWHRHPKNEYGELIEWSTKRVPIEHQWIDGDWMVPSGECALLYCYDLSDTATDATALGTYELHLEWDGDFWLTSIGKLVPTSPDSGSDQ